VARSSGMQGSSSSGLAKRASNGQAPDRCGRTAEIRGKGRHAGTRRAPWRRQLRTCCRAGTPSSQKRSHGIQTGEELCREPSS
jgi:hypothetical protein